MPEIIDITKPFYLEIDSVEEKDNKLNWETLKKVGDNLQGLINSLFSEKTDEKILGSESIKIRFNGMYKGSAVPCWELPIENNLLFNNHLQIAHINKNLNIIVSAISKNNFEELNNISEDTEYNNKIIDSVYCFTNSVGVKKFNFVKPNKDKKSFTKVFKINAMSLKSKNKIYNRPKMAEPEPEFVEYIAKVNATKNIQGKLQNKKTTLYTNKEASLALKFDSIEYDKKLYTLNTELVCPFTNPNDNNFNIENQLLDIYAFGETLKEAKFDFSMQFDYTYKRLTSIEDNILSEHLRRAKTQILLIVNNIKDL